MTEEQQITDAFMKDFEELLRRYNAEFNVYRDEGDNPRAGIDFDSIYDYEEDRLVKPYIFFELPDCINPNR